MPFWRSKNNTENKDLPISNIERTDSQELDVCDVFPVVKLPESSLQNYQKIPLGGLGILGAAFSQLPQTARTIVQSTIKTIDLNEPLFVGINPKNVPGYLRFPQSGTSGNIMQINEQGKHVIAGRMRFKPVDSLPLNEMSTTAIPFDPTTMMIAVAVMVIEQKLDKIQASIEEVLQFLELDKKAKQRGNFKMLAEIADDYKEKCHDKVFCANRNIGVKEIQRAALQDIEFYQDKINLELQKQKTLHLAKDSTALVNSVSREFAEYQLACYLYGYSNFLDVMLRRDFDEKTLDKTVSRLKALSDKYNTLYSTCRSQIAEYQRGTIDAKVVGGLGIAAKNIGKAIGSIPLIRDVSVDEALINAGESLGKLNRAAVENQLGVISCFEDSKMNSFIDSLNSVNTMYNTKDSILTDGENLYVLKRN